MRMITVAGRRHVVYDFWHVLDAEWSKALPPTASCLSPMPRFASCNRRQYDLDQQIIDYEIHTDFNQH